VSKRVAFAHGSQAMPLPPSTSEQGCRNRNIEMWKFENRSRFGAEQCHWQVSVISG
jgi:hypothetical protein